MSYKYVSPSGLARYDKNIKEYVDGKVIEISLSDYSALTEEEQNNGTIYMIPDGNEVSTDVTIDEVPTEGSKNLVTSGGVYNELTEINSNITNINDSMNNKGTLLVPYVTLESGVSTQTDNTNNWSDYKGFVLGIECTGGDGTSYCETKYIPQNYAIISDGFKYVMTLNFSDLYSFTGVVRLYVSSQKVAFTTTAFSGWTNPRWFLYGIK